MLPLVLAALLSSAIGAPCVVVDPGHGGPNDDGTTAIEHKEKIIALQVAKRLRDAITSAMSGVEVVLTRDSDREVPILERARLANTRKCQALVSVHVNGSVEDSLHGLEVYSLDTSKSRHTARVRERLGPQASDTDVIVADLRSRGHAETSVRLATLVHDRVLHALRSIAPDVRTGGVRKSGLLLLLVTDAPSVLVELGYLSNPRERERLLDGRYQQAAANAIALALKDFLQP